MGGRRGASAIDWAQEAACRDTARPTSQREPPLHAGSAFDAEALDACTRLKQEGIVWKKLDARYSPGVRTGVGAK